MILCSEYGGQPNTIICGFVCDTVDEVKDLPTTTKKGSGILQVLTTMQISVQQ